VVCLNFRAESELVGVLKTKERNETSQNKDPETQHTPPGEEQSEASFGSLILLPRLQLLFEES
jgi:hypothetical protein